MAATDCRCVLTAKDNGRSRSNRTRRDSLPRPPGRTRSGSSPRRTQDTDGKTRQVAGVADRPSKHECRASTDGKGPERRNRRGQAHLGPGRGRRTAAGRPPHRSQHQEAIPTALIADDKGPFGFEHGTAPRPSRVTPAPKLGPRTQNRTPKAALPETETPAVLPQTRPIRPSTRSADRRKPDHVQRDPRARRAGPDPVLKDRTGVASFAVCVACLCGRCVWLCGCVACPCVRVLCVCMCGCVACVRMVCVCGCGVFVCGRCVCVVWAVCVREGGPVAGPPFVVCRRRCPTLPHPGGCSTIGAGSLSFRVRKGKRSGRVPAAVAAATRAGPGAVPGGRVWDSGIA